MPVLALRAALETATPASAVASAESTDASEDEIPASEATSIPKFPPRSPDPRPRCASAMVLAQDPSTPSEPELPLPSPTVSAEDAALMLDPTAILAIPPTSIASTESTEPTTSVSSMPCWAPIKLFDTAMPLVLVAEESRVDCTLAAISRSDAIAKLESVMPSIEVVSATALASPETTDAELSLFRTTGV